MSGFFGVISPDCKVDHGAFDQMRAAMITDGYDGLTIYSNDKIAFGHLMLRTTPESKFDQQPLKSECGRIVMVGHFRIDYRDELADKLGIAQAELEKLPDSYLVLRSYSKWGNRCVNHLEGDWAFVLYDNHKHSIFVARDKIGYSALFHCKIGNNFYFSSDLDVLVAGLNQVEVDKVQLYLMSLGRNYITKGKTLFKGVFFLHPSSSIEIDKQLNYVATHTNFLKYTPKLNFRFKRDYFLEFKSSFQIALKNKILGKGDFGILLSGGYDSFLVAKSSDLQFRKTGQKLYSFTRLPIEVGSKKDVIADKDEFEVVMQFQKDFARTIFHSSSYTDINSSQFLSKSSELNSFNPIVTANTYWLEGSMSEARKKVRLVLTGQFGNYSLSWDSPKNELFISLLSILKNYIYLVLNRFLKEKSIFNSAKYLNPLQGLYVFLELFKRQRIFFSKNEFRKYILYNNGYDLGARQYSRAFRNRIIALDPTADERFLLISYSIPEKLFNHNEVSKYIYRKSFNNILTSDFFSVSTSNIGQSANFRLKCENDKLLYQFLDDHLKLIGTNPNFISDRLSISEKVDNEAFIENFFLSDLAAINLLRHLSILRFYYKMSNFRV
jgi:hypothetical protein